MKPKIGVFTATRAEYGLLFNVMREIKACKNLDLQTYVSGTHLSSEFGKTYKDIEADGFQIDAFIEMNLSTSNSFLFSNTAGVNNGSFPRNILV